MPVEYTFPTNCGISEENVKAYLEELRESGDTNMFGASPYLESEFGMSRNDAKAALTWWMGQY